MTDTSPHSVQRRDQIVDEIFVNLPYGIVVVDPEGSVVGLNPGAASMLLGDLPADPLECSQLFRCDAPGGPCEHECLARRGSGFEQSPPEIRIDTRPGGDASAVWVTAASIGAGNTLLHLRPGHAQDRRRRTDTEWFDRPTMRLRALGQTAVEGHADGPADGRWLAQRPGQLLKYLVSQRDRVVHAEQIAEALWPGTRRGLSNVRFTVHALRNRLEPGRESKAQDSLVVAVAGGYVLDRRRISIDADEFDAAVHAGVAEFTKGDEHRGREHLEAALALYRGDLFAEERYAEWAQPERERLRELLGRALRLLALIDRRTGDLSTAQDHLERLVALEPFDEDVVRDLLSVLHEQGRRTRAARFYEAFRIRMHETFDEFPGFDLDDVSSAPSQPT